MGKCVAVSACLSRASTGNGRRIDMHYTSSVTNECCGQVHVAQASECLVGTGFGVRSGVWATNRLIDYVCNLCLPLTSVTNE
jgi:hypothetical protein